MGCDIHGWLEIRRGEAWGSVHKVPNDRTYDLFGILADVRNYVGLKPIAHPRGLVTEELSFWAKDDYGKWGPNAHSASWLNWSDIEKYDWDQKSIDGRVSIVKKETGEERMKASYINPDSLSDDEEITHLERTAKDLVPLKWKGLFKEMAFFAQELGQENVRIVFWFDN